jgi:hypothetical protein
MEIILPHAFIFHIGQTSRFYILFCILFYILHYTIILNKGGSVPVKL